MKRIWICLTLLVFSAQSFSQNQERPNIILIHVDDLGATDLGVFGSDFYETPHLDRLAAEGMRFTQSYAAAHICSPSRAALLTGKYPARIGITDWIRAKFQGVTTSGLPGEYEEFADKPLKTPKIQGFLPLEEQTIAERLKSLGYTTLHVGKWHLGDEGMHPENQGFDVNVGGNDLGQPPSYFDPYLPAQPREFYQIKNLPPRKPGEFLTDRESDEVIGFLEVHRRQPFFVHWAPYAVHTPIMGPVDLVEKYKQKKPGQQRNPVYAALIENLDANVGKLLAYLDEKGIRENTLLIFTSDNGGLIGNKANPVTWNIGMREYKGYPYEGGIRVPTIVSMPGTVPAGTTSDVPTISMDWISTALEAAGENPDQPELEGESLWSVLTGANPSLERDLFWHFPHYRAPDVTPHSVVRSGDYKLIYYFDGKEPELFDLSNDPEEKINLAKQLPLIVMQLKTKLEGFWENTDARLPVTK
ncbi:sulfatase [Algoriphagus aestuariicola]|uniref:Sulfatase n=1 Tax=Algoriphagus aestuariicola TaxID=1852016 RepID=A0ABS3BUY0_9BACT|nr:sulfatase [Algoriphagus aestuariicola]MBN7803097.1 sulfatase [Algoriphagus aestuariicola]